MAQVSVAHVRVQGIDVAVFGGDSQSRTRESRAALLTDLTARARSAGLRIHKSALAYEEFGRVEFFGTRDLVGFLAHNGLPQWTHTLNV